MRKVKQETTKRNSKPRNTKQEINLQNSKLAKYEIKLNTPKHVKCENLNNKNSKN